MRIEVKSRQLKKYEAEARAVAADDGGPALPAGSCTAPSRSAGLASAAQAFNADVTT